MKVLAEQTIQICLHCHQRLGQDHRLDCPFTQESAVQISIDVVVPLVKE